MSRPDDLATLVRDAAPRPSAEFLEGLDGRVAERFGKPERPRRFAPATWPKWRIAGGLAAACAAGAIVVVAVGGNGGGDAVDLSSTGPARAQKTAAPSAAAGARAPKPTATQSTA